MPETAIAREKIREYIKNSDTLTQTAIATYFNMNRQNLQDMLNGKDKGVKAHHILTAIIKMYGIK